MKKQFDFESSDSKELFISLSKHIRRGVVDKHIDFINGFFNYHTKKIIELSKTSGNYGKIMESIILLDMFGGYVYIRLFLSEKAVIIKELQDRELTKMFKKLLRNNKIFQKSYFKEIDHNQFQQFYLLHLLLYMQIHQ